MTSEQAAQLINQALAQVHQRLESLQSDTLGPERRALLAEFREWSTPRGDTIELFLVPSWP
jgi:hypothetical protein